MSDLNWKPSSLSLNSSPRPLKFAVLSILIGFITLILFSAFYEVESSLFTQGEVISIEGEKTMVAAREGSLEEISVQVGDGVKKGQVLGQIQIPFSDSNRLTEIAQELKRRHQLLIGSNFDSGDTVFPDWQEIKSDNPSVARMISEAESAWEKYALADRSFKLLAQKKLQYGTFQKKKLSTRIYFLKKNSEKAGSGLLVDELEEKLQKLEIEQIALSEEAHAKIAVARTNALASLNNLNLQMNEFLESYQIKAYSDGTLSRRLVSSLQHVSKDQPLFSILPTDAPFNTVLKVPSAEVGNVKINQSVLIEVDSFPHRRHGYFSGRVESIDQGISLDESKRAFYFVRTSLLPPDSDARDIASSIMLLPGMKIAAFIKTQKRPLIRLIYEKIFSNEAP